MIEWPSSPEEVTEIPVDRLAIGLLRQLARSHRGRIQRASMTAMNRLHDLGINTNSLDARRAIGEAFDWLAIHGLIAAEPGILNGFWYITPRGERMLGEPDPIATIQATKRLDMDLHPSITDRVRSQFILGEYESAVFLAFREVEIRVRDLGGFDTSLIGVPLMRQAFSPKGGRFCDTTLDGGEQQAMMDLFAGAIGAFKNPSSHRQVDYGDATVAAEAVLLADLLLRILDRYPNTSPPEPQRTAEQ